MIRCPICEIENTDDTIFCKKCGVNLSSAFAAARKTDNNPKNDENEKTETIFSNSTRHEGNAISIRIAAILIFIVTGLWAFSSTENIKNLISFQSNINTELISMYAIMMIFGVFLGIEVLKKSASGYSCGLNMGGYAMIWYGYQAISSQTIGYFMAILCAISFLLILSNSRQVDKEHRSTDDVDIRLIY